MCATPLSVASEMRYDDRKRRTRDSNVALQDLERTTLSTRAARKGESVVQANTTRLDDAGDKKPEARSRTEDSPRAGKEAVVQNTVIDDRRADPQRVRRADPQLVKRAYPTTGT